MSEPRDPWRMNLPRGMFLENLHGDDALKLAASVASGEPPAVVVEVPAVLVSDESSVPVAEESSSVPAIVDASVDASAAEPQSDASPEPPVETRP